MKAMKGKADGNHNWNYIKPWNYQQSYTECEDTDKRLNYFME
jgi:hypothetical protein